MTAASTPASTSSSSSSKTRRPQTARARWLLKDWDTDIDEEKEEDDEDGEGQKKEQLNQQQPVKDEKEVRNMEELMREHAEEASMVSASEVFSSFQSHATLF